MKPGKKKIAVLLSILVVFLVVVTSLAVVLVRLADLRAHKEEIVHIFKSALNRDVSYTSADLSFSWGPVLTFGGMQIREKDGSSTFVTLDRLAFKVDLLPLLWRKIVVRAVWVENPRVMLVRYPSGQFNISDLFEGDKTSQSFEIKGLDIKNGHVEFDDRGIDPAGVRTVLDGLHARIGNLTRGKKSSLDIETGIIQEGSQGSFAFHGKIGLSGKRVPLYKSVLEGSARIQGLSVGRLWPYYRQYVPFEQLAGTLDADSHVKGNIDGFSVSGTISASKVVLNYPKVFHAVLTPQKVTVACQLKRTPSEVDVAHIRASVDDVKISGHFAIKDIDKRDPLISASAKTTPMPLETYGAYIPYGIIPKSVADFIEDHIKGGTYQLLEGTLEGRVSRIAHMEKDQNYNVLHILAQVKDGRLAFGTDIPAFNKISGELELRGKDFHLRQMSGLFGRSPLSLEGKITDYPLEGPVSYPFSMTMTPSPEEVDWLMSLGGGLKAAFSGRSTLKVTGKGTADQYDLAGDWDLTDADYGYEDILTKRKGQPNRLAFHAVLNDRAVRLIDGSYDLPPLSLKASGLYPFQEKDRLSFSFASNPLRIEKLETAFPVIKKWHPIGTIQLSARMEGPVTTWDDTLWHGAIKLSHFSFQPGGPFVPVTDLNGTIRLQNDALETSLLEGRLGGGTPFSARAVLSGFVKPDLNLYVSAKNLDLRDIGLKSPAGRALLNDVTANVVWHDRGIRIKSLSASVNRSHVAVTGVISDFEKPFVDIQVTSPHLDTADLEFIKDLAETDQSGTASGLTVKAAIKSAGGRLQKLPYTNLSAKFTYGQDGIKFDTFHFNALGGSISGQGHYVSAAGMQPRYRLNFEIDKISAKQVVSMTDLDPDLITGTLSLKGDLAGVRFADAKELGKTATGTAKLRMEKGTLRKFSVLSKVFSILNVSQLLKFQLPNMVSDGMPYTTVTGEFSLKNGILSSNDLYVTSDAINISVVGKADLVKKELEETIGVQPLQTVDKVVSHIPVVGWILTNETNSIISMYFTAKGPWDNPDVQAIPAKDMAQGIFNIFRRLFQLPAKLITDTGDVILGR